MSKINDGGPAFARTFAGAERDRHLLGMPESKLPFGHNGLSMRDYFAAKAMQGMLACEMLRATEQEFSERAYAIADAMLKAREQS